MKLTGNFDFSIYIKKQLKYGCGCKNCQCLHCPSSSSFLHHNQNIKVVRKQLLNLMTTDDNVLCKNINPVLFNSYALQQMNDFCDLIYDTKIDENDSDANKIMNIEDFLDKIIKYIDNQEIFCALFMGNGYVSKTNYNINEELICTFMKISKKIMRKYSENPTIQNRANKIFQVLYQQLQQLSNKDSNQNAYSHYHLRGIFISLAFFSFLDLNQFLTLFKTIIQFMKNGKKCLIHDMYYVASKYTKYLKYNLQITQKQLSAISEKLQNQEFFGDFEDKINSLLKSIVKHIQFMSDANDISDDPIPSIYFQNQSFSDILSPQVEVLNMFQGKFSFLSKSSLLTFPFKKEAYHYTTKLLMLAHEDEDKKTFDLNIRRNFVLDDTISILSKVEDQHELLKRLNLSFINEIGIDEGGLSREYFSLAAPLLFDSKYFEKHQNFIFFKQCYEAKNDTLYNDEYIKHYTICGKFVALAIHNFVCLPIRFPNLLYKILKKVMIRIEDLSELDPQLVQSLNSIMKISSEEEFKYMSLFFETTVYDSIHNKYKTFPLIENGSEIPVTKCNFHKYIFEMKRFIISSYEPAIIAFQKGLLHVIESKFLKIFTDEELSMIVSGQQIFNWKEFKQSTKYESGYNENSETVKLFWDVFENFLNEEERREFLSFATGSKSLPLEGLSSLNFIISRSGDLSLLPVAHTCFNILNLPDYKDLSILQKNLHICILNNKGFGIK